MRLIVTGAHGFIGTWATAELRRRGHEVLTVGINTPSRMPRPEARYDGILSIDRPGEDFAVLLADWRPDGILHLAGTVDASKPEKLFALNAGYAAILLEALARSEFRRCPLVLVGSAAEYGPLPNSLVPLDETAPTEPRSLYGISKLAQSRIGLAAARCGQPVVVARPFNVIGAGMPSMLSLPSFAQRIAAADTMGRPLPAGNLNAVRDFISVQSTAEALATLLECPGVHGRVVNLCGGRPYRIGDVVDRMIHLSGKAVNADLSNSCDGMTDIAYGDPSLAASLTGWRAPPLRDADLLAVMREHGCPLGNGEEDAPVPVLQSSAIPFQPTP